MRDESRMRACLLRYLRAGSAKVFYRATRKRTKSLRGIQGNFHANQNVFNLFRPGSKLARLGSPRLENKTKTRNKNEIFQKNAEYVPADVAGWVTSSGNSGINT